MYYNTIELADRIVSAIKEAGHWPDEGGVAKVDYALPDYTNLPCEEATERWLRVQVDFGGSEGIYLDLFYCSKLGPEVREASILTIKTLADSDEAFVTFYELAGWIQLIGRRCLLQYEKELLEAPEVEYCLLSLNRFHPGKYKHSVYFRKHYSNHALAEYEQAEVFGKIPWRGEDTARELVKYLHGSHRTYVSPSDILVFWLPDGARAFYVEESGLEESPKMCEIVLNIPERRFLTARDNVVYFCDTQEWKWLSDVDLYAEYFAIVDRFKEGEFFSLHLQDTIIRYLDNKVESFEEGYKERIALHEHMGAMQKLPFYVEHKTPFFEVSEGDLEKIANMRRARQ